MGLAEYFTQRAERAEHFARRIEQLQEFGREHPERATHLDAQIRDELHIVDVAEVGAKMRERAALCRLAAAAFE